jgi:hypothetical protein
VAGCSGVEQSLSIRMPYNSSYIPSFVRITGCVSLGKGASGT